MPRYYFHLRDGSSVQEDATGVELPDLDAARKHALESACAIWTRQPPDPEHNDQSYEIHNETGEAVLTVDFSEAFAERAVT